MKLSERIASVVIDKTYFGKEGSGSFELFVPESERDTDLNELRKDARDLIKFKDIGLTNFRLKWNGENVKVAWSNWEDKAPQRSLWKLFEK